MADEVITLRKTWRLGPEIKRGGFGRVHEAVGDDGFQAAVKLVPKAPGASRELLFEPVSNVPNVIPIIDSGEWKDFYVLVMPRAEKSLRQHLIDNGGKLAVHEAVGVLLDVAQALSQLSGVVHRDLKPENVLLYQGHWCLSDFGISRYADATTAPDTHKYALTPAYAAPEQWRSERATAVTDVYAFGVMAFELLTGQKPFPGPDVSDFRTQHLTQSPPAMTGIPPALASLVTECLAKPAGARPTPANIITRLNASQQVPSPAVAKLQAVNQEIVQSQARQGAQMSAQASTAEQRAALLDVAEQSLGRILDTLLARLEQAAPTVKVTRGRGVTAQLGNGKLLWDQVRSAPPDCLKYHSSKAPFDVIGYSAIAALKPRDYYGYEGRSHSLWYCDAHEAGVYRWFETAFMIQPLIRETSTVEPFALAPIDEETAGAFSHVVTVRQVAWEPLPFDQGDEEQFIEHWLGWLAAAADGTLRRPSTMPENSGCRHRS